MGGIYRNETRDTEHRVPGLGRVPLTGRLFRRTEKSRQKTELMVFVTPTIHETPESVTWDRMLDLTGVAAEAQALDTERQARRE